MSRGQAGRRVGHCPPFRSGRPGAMRTWHCHRGSALEATANPLRCTAHGRSARDLGGRGSVRAAQRPRCPDAVSPDCCRVHGMHRCIPCTLRNAEDVRPTAVGTHRGARLGRNFALPGRRKPTSASRRRTTKPRRAILIRQAKRFVTPAQPSSAQISGRSVADDKGRAGATAGMGRAADARMSWLAPVETMDKWGIGIVSVGPVFVFQRGTRGRSHVDVSEARPCS